VLKGIQDKTALLPGYHFTPSGNEPKKEGVPPAWPGIDAGTSAAGIVGAAIVLGMIMLIGAGIRSFRGRN
jgi:cobalt/nickel transport system permease protein